MTHSEQLLALRPEIEIEITGKEEPFQLFRSQTLRQVMKMQHEILVKLFVTFEGSNLEGLSILDKRARIDNIFSKNLQLKSMLAGVVIGCFTETEFAFFLENKSEISKEIKMLTVKRIKDELTGKAPMLEITH